MNQQVLKRPPGRPYIGRHMQTRVPDENAQWIEEEAERRGMDCPDFFRHVIAVGVATLKRGEA